MKIMIKTPHVTPVQNFCGGFDHTNLVYTFHGSEYLPKITYSNVYFFKYEHLKRFVWKDEIFA